MFHNPSDRASYSNLFFFAPGVQPFSCKIDLDENIDPIHDLFPARTITFEAHHKQHEARGAHNSTTDQYKLITASTYHGHYQY